MTVILELPDYSRIHGSSLYRSNDAPELQVGNRRLRVFNLVMITRHRTITKEDLTRYIVEHAVAQVSNNKNREFLYLGEDRAERFNDKEIAKVMQGLSRRFVHRLADAHEPTIDYVLESLHFPHAMHEGSDYWLRVVIGMLPCRDVTSMLAVDTVEPESWCEAAFERLYADPYLGCYGRKSMPLVMPCEDNLEATVEISDELIESVQTRTMQGLLGAVRDINQRMPGCFGQLEDRTRVIEGVLMLSVLKDFKRNYDMLRGH
ncbi:MAG TPA: hypothetical protein VJB87_03635 [Candidatus Nanoarchaeia archaeon]|nr:hypothetical protein [Candidatus Nanoarchaeia archaeon]